MKGKNLIFLVIVAAVLGGLAIVSTRRNTRPVSSAVGEKLFPELDVNAVAKVTITSEAEAVSLAHKDGTWVVEDRYDFPADIDKVAKLLITLSEQKISQTATLDDDQIKELQLCQPGAADTVPGTAGNLLTLYGSDGSTLGSLIVGRPRIRKIDGPIPGYNGFPDGQYVLTSDGLPCLLAQALQQVDPAPPSWLLSELPNIPARDIAGVTLARTDGTQSTLVRTDDNQLVLSDLEEGEEMDSSATYQVEGALSYMRLIDVADPALTDKETGLDAPGVYTATTRSGQIFTAEIGGSPQGSRERYVRFRVGFDPALRPALGIADDADQATRDAAEAEEQAARDTLQAETEALNARLSAWVYVIERHKADGMLNARDLLIKKNEVSTASEPIEKVEARKAQAAEYPLPVPQ